MALSSSTLTDSIGRVHPTVSDPTGISNASISAVSWGAVDAVGAGASASAAMSLRNYARHANRSNQLRRAFIWWFLNAGREIIRSALGGAHSRYRQQMFCA